ncbi:MAG TPA: sigma-54 dependent transcriptional regulator [Gemmatimonadales bacterium]|nr:sigma-54 dependent transcriptional regulator [Gemmatimonadales bacterium]
MAFVLAVDDDAGVLRILERILRREGHTVATACSGEAALTSVGTRRPDAVVLDVQMPGIDGLETLARLRHQVPGVPVVIMTGLGDVDTAVLAFKRGAADFVVKPFVEAKLLLALGSALAAGTGAPGPHAPAVIGGSPRFRDAMDLAIRLARPDINILLEGETGTGKELFARAIHAASARKGGPFVPVDCSTLAESLIESELFGHEKGAFSGAVTRKIGRFELARGGTLFLDEIADMTLPLQAKILRAVQEREIERVGGGDPIPIDVRLIAASNRELRDAIQQGRFREDLYYRLAVVIVRLPRLSERGADLALLAAYFARQFASQYGKHITGFSDRTLELLTAHRWVGNVRELRNAIEQAVIVADGGTILVEHLPDEIRGHEGSLAGTLSGELATLAEAEARHIARVLAHTGGQIGAAATILGIHRNTLTRKIREYGL